ncbi:MAG: GNAT family N-acetyltransferase [Geobacteraceae bacterium]|jgi:GNAT superfamily N-acetyltransferase
MTAQLGDFPFIRRLNATYEKRIRQIPFLNIDSVLIPTPYEKHRALDIDYEHSYVWDEEGELLGYLLVYSNAEKTQFHIYKLVTSPFGRGKGIGSAFVEKLAGNVSPDAHIYLYVWEKLISSIDFFNSKGFAFEEEIAYRKMKFHLMSARAGELRERMVSVKTKEFTVAEELGKVRHDAKKSLKVLLDMASMLSVDNFNKVIEDINRETTALLNTLNMYEDKVKISHEVNIKELITDRVIPVIEATTVPCEIRLTLSSKIPPVNGNYMSFSRALINLVSNSIDAIKEAGRRGIIEIKLSEKDDRVVLTILDNGAGIAEERLERGADMLPLFVGKTTKKVRTGEGLGTLQVFSTFGANNIDIESRLNEFTSYTIYLTKSSKRDKTVYTEFESNYLEVMKSTQRIGVRKNSSQVEIAAFIWQLRKIETFSYDLVYQFSRYNNVRDIYRNLMMYLYGGKDFNYIKTELKKYRIDNENIKTWLLDIIKRIKRQETFILQNLNFDEYKGVLFESFGQAIERTIVFTLEPESGKFYATDRKLAEHLDFVPYLSPDRDSLLRGEFIGDVRNVQSPIYLGVWSVKNRPDMYDKLRLIRKGAEQLLKMGLRKEKQLFFYNTTYNKSDCEIDTLKTTTLGEMAELKEEDFEQFITESDDELQGMVFAV